MRSVPRTLFSAVTAAALVVGAGGAAVFAADDDEEEDAGPSPEQVKLANDALDKAVARGKALWASKDTAKKSCAQCHDDADKPKLNLATRPWRYPAYSRRAKRVVSLDQKLNEMAKFNGRGTQYAYDGEDLAALAAYVTSLKHPKK